jgi:hypothetical protein
MATTTAVEVDILNQDGTSQSNDAYFIDRPAKISVSTAGPATSIRNGDNASQVLSKGRGSIVITQLAGINFITSFSNGECL